MMRFMRDLGDLTGLDIVARDRCAPVQGAVASPQDGAAGATLSRSALRWLGLTPADDGRCRGGGSAHAESVRRPASSCH